MTDKQKQQFNRMLHALRKIARGYSTPGQLRRTAERDYGLPYCEVLEMAYDNIQQDAGNAVNGVREMKDGKQ